MRLLTVLLSIFLALVNANDGCPKESYACLDIMNASQCIAQLVLDHISPLTKEAMVKCVETEGSASNLPGASRLCMCPGCHSAPINAVIEEMFPPPCIVRRNDNSHEIQVQ